MAKIAETLVALGIKDWTLTGEPTTEAEFKKSFKKVTGEDSNGSAILSDDESKFGVTWSEIKEKKTELETAEKNMSDKDKGKQKLKDLGLSDDEITALIGG
mgnify:CR=1 FL=1|tara:strand:- start:1675 stop:1977 length:303 start_codon:yes stop_codon:yes gene_type:complete